MNILPMPIKQRSAPDIKRKARRFPTTNEKIVLRKWLELNKNHRPSSIDLNFLASQTKMTKVQIKKWLITNKYELIKKKRNINFQQEKTLAISFMKNAYPSNIEMQQLMNFTTLSKKRLSQWFKHKRLDAKKRKNFEEPAPQD